MAGFGERRVVFLRGLNVGGHRVKMAALREHFGDMGFHGVETLQASGNVILSDAGNADAPVIEARVEAGLAAALGYEVPAFVRTLAEVSASLGEGPVSDAELQGPDHAHYVLFLKEAPDGTVRKIFRDLDSDRDSFRVHRREVHWLSRGKLSESPLFGGPFEKATRDVVHTMRKATTLRRLLAKYGD